MRSVCGNLRRAIVFRLPGRVLRRREAEQVGEGRKDPPPPK